MKRISREQFRALLKERRVRPRIVRDVRFAPEDIADWDDWDMLAVPTKSGNEGVLLAQTDALYVLPYELNTDVKDNATGRTKPITCDLCYTWQRGGKAGRITFTRASDGHTFTYLCCGDLRCSLHVRGKTPEAALSRAQLPEDITTERRIARLQTHVGTIVEKLGVRPVINA